MKKVRRIRRVGQGTTVIEAKLDKVPVDAAAVDAKVALTVCATTRRPNGGGVLVGRGSRAALPTPRGPGRDFWRRMRRLCGPSPMEAPR